MTGWVLSKEKPGYLEKTMQRGNCTITIYRPELPPAERERRESIIRDEMARGIKDYIMQRERICK